MKTFRSLAVLFSLSAALAAPVAAATLGYIYVGPEKDYGYNTSMDIGRQYVAKNLPGTKTLHVENVPETAEVEKVMERMIRSGASIIFATSYGYLDYAVSLGKKYPKVAFLHAGGLKLGDNVGTYWANSDDAMYLAGMAAGAVSKSGKLGFIAAFPIPQVVRSINAFTLGAQAMNPKATTSVVWTGGWLLPAKEAEATNSLVDAGIDVIGEQVDSPITIAQTAEKRGIHVVGKDVDVSKLAPKAVLTGASWNWGPTMLKLTKEIQAGTWKPSHVRGDLKDGTVVLDPFGAAVPQAARATVLAKKQDILDGKFVVWSGPLAGQEGHEILPAGKPMPMEQLESMNFFVRGVIGTVK
ncbi:BMP family ABC transporter substrate-binding protein [Aquabacterium sp. J223]|uniref:BMP family ABC transporter substrate-binding protein n=1 Tax=Aquabacterium sp. J223 TaxID=2898431 RepID=UPI0021AD5544|nr:BMP family ABC transporter substrate-binding protein [Aquabacterium sp. J223]UUX97187.1 BMP family ABC transporter substrate-binding protein [Aquabacterium sp. J223]